ncbi:MAG: hypothetical protein ACKO7Z_08775 [Cyanobacteriota bacterium]
MAIPPGAAAAAPAAPPSLVLAPRVLAPYANARLLLFSIALAGMSESQRTGRLVFEAFLKRLQRISSKDDRPGVDTVDFSYEGFLTRGTLLPLSPTSPWDWLAAAIPWSSSGGRPISATTPALVAPCHGAIWLGEQHQCGAQAQPRRPARPRRQHRLARRQAWHHRGWWPLIPPPSCRRNCDPRRFRDRADALVQPASQSVTI